MSSAIGVLALQGGYEAHETALRELGHTVVRVRYAAQLPELAGLVFPGGESTTMLKIIAREGLREPLDQLVASGRPVLCTCAGLILAATAVSHPEQESFGWLDVSVARNGWGRQLDSFEAVADGTDIPLLFIRAPRITRVGAHVQVVHTFEGEPICVRQGAVTAATFHPELTPDRRLHRAVFGGSNEV